jgi:taurine dioxygenase
MAQDIEIRPTGATLGADVRGGDFANLDEGTLGRLRAALGEHLVLRFRGTELSDADYMALGRRLGEIVPPEAHTRTADMTAPDFPEMSVISNVVEGGVAKGEAGDGELRWHTDHGFMERPAAYTMLLAREVPAQGGDTSFANMCRAYDEMADDLRARAAGLSVKHQASHSSTGKRRPGYADITTTDPRELPGAIHPIVRTHPESGRRALYRPAFRLLHSAAAARGERGPARCAVGRGDPRRADLDSVLAGGRPGHLGQPLHHASARGLCRARPPPHAPPDDAGRAAGLRSSRLPVILSGILRLSGSIGISRGACGLRAGPGPAPVSFESSVVIGGVAWSIPRLRPQSSTGFSRGFARLSGSIGIAHVRRCALLRVPRRARPRERCSA